MVRQRADPRPPLGVLLTMDDHILYRLYDTAGALLYVGITNNLKRRFERHTADKPWWSDVATWRTDSLPGRSLLEAAEIVAIRYEQPRYNKRDRGWFPRLTCSGCGGEIKTPLSANSGAYGMAVWLPVGGVYGEDNMPKRPAVSYACNSRCAALALGTTEHLWRPLGLFLAQEEWLARNPQPLHGV